MKKSELPAKPRRTSQQRRRSELFVRGILTTLESAADAVEASADVASAVKMLRESAAQLRALHKVP